MKSIFKRSIKTCAAIVAACAVSAPLLVYGQESITPSEKEGGIYTVVENGAEIPEILGESAIVVDMATGHTLYEKNIYDSHYPASITKIMTALLTLEQATLDEVVTFSYEAVFSVEAGSSAAYVDVDEQLTVEQCLYGLMLISGNDLANGLAEHVGGSMDNFASMMTERADELGCVNTNFVNAHGLHSQSHYTCAYDMALIAKEAYETQEKFRTICSTLTYECKPTNKQPEIRLWRNKNRLINPYEDLYYEDCIGGKTGYTNEAGGTLVTYANINGRDLMCVIMKSTHSAAAFADTTTLYEYIRENVTSAIYDELDKQYAASEGNKPEENTGDSLTTQSTDTGRATDNSGEDEEESGGMWIGFKIGILLVTIFIIYYVYVRYMRYLDQKRRRQRRMRERRQRQRR